jgi:hypothetical protein
LMPCQPSGFRALRGPSPVEPGDVSPGSAARPPAGSRRGAGARRVCNAKDLYSGTRSGGGLCKALARFGERSVAGGLGMTVGVGGSITRTPFPPHASGIGSAGTPSRASDGNRLASFSCVLSPAPYPLSILAISASVSAIRRRATGRRSAHLWRSSSSASRSVARRTASALRSWVW